jgi:hypothetical protein
MSPATAWKRAFDDVHPTQTPAYAWTDLLNAHDGQGIHIDSQTAATRWRGERMDDGLAIEGLLQQADRARHAHPGQHPKDAQNVSAETSDVETDIEHDAEWRRHDEEGTFYLTL